MTSSTALEVRLAHRPHTDPMYEKPSHPGNDPLVRELVELLDREDQLRTEAARDGDTLRLSLLMAQGAEKTENQRWTEALARIVVAEAGDA